MSHIILLFLQLLVLIGISSLLYGLALGARGNPRPGLPRACRLRKRLDRAPGVAGPHPGRINALGMALTLVFGILSRSFAAVIPTTPWMDTLARITPNYWGQHAFLALALGGGPSSILRDLGALGIMCAALWAAAALRDRSRSSQRSQ